MSDLKNVYSQMWIDSIDRFKANNCETDQFINDPTDTRRGLTVLSYLDEPVSTNIGNFLEELKAIEPAQYYYPENELHITMLSIISCIAGFKLSNIDTEAYATIFKETLEGTGGFKIKFQGITVSPSCILIQGFPESEQLSLLRKSLRVNFKKAKLESTIDSRYELSTAHSTVVRCVAPFKNSNNVIKILEKYRNHDFGTLEVNSFQLVFNNWYQNLSITKNLASSILKPKQKKC